MIEVDQLSYRVDGGESLQILQDISFSLAAGRSLAIVGASGSGKTTLLGLLAGLDKPTQGSVKVAGVSIGALDEDERAAFRAEHCAIVFQSFHLLPQLSALENVLMPLELFSGDAREHNEAKAERLLAQVGLSHRMAHKPSELSGGEQQRVAIARAFACGGEVLLADEPTGNLDFATGQAVIDLLFDMNKQEGKTLVLVTHDKDLASRCDQMLQLHDGQIITEPA